MRSKVNYRKIYGSKNIPKGWHVHHIDWDSSNNQLDNLIAIPKLIHKIIHSINLVMEANNNLKVADIMERPFIENLLGIYKKNTTDGKRESEIEEVILMEMEHLFKDEGLIEVPKERLEKMLSKWTTEEILNWRHHYPKGKTGDDIYSHIFGEE